MARGNGKPSKRVISVGSIPKRLIGNVIYVDIRPDLEGIEVQARSNEQFEHQYEGEHIVRSTIQARFFQYHINLEKENSVELGQYINGIRHRFVGIGNFLVKLAEKNNAEIRPNGAFKGVETLHNGLEEMLRKVRSHLRD